MNTRLLIAALLLVSALSRLVADEVQLRKGDDKEKIRELLGEPNGFMESKRHGVYYYDRGEVHTRDGKVTIIDLIRPEELEIRRNKAEEERALRKAEGEEVLAEILEDDFFPLIDAADRVAFWERFHVKYPEVDIGIPYTKARLQAEREAEERREAERLARLERRVWEAEREAADAKRQADTARRMAETERHWYRPRYIVIPRTTWYRHPSPVPDSDCTPEQPPGTWVKPTYAKPTLAEPIRVEPVTTVPRNTAQNTLSFLHER